MKRLLAFLLIIMLSVFAGCTGSGNDALPENNYTPHFDEPPYITFKNTDWGMSIEQVLDVLGWEDSEWEDKSNPESGSGFLRAGEGAQRFWRTNVAFHGGYVDVAPTFYTNRRFFEDEPYQNVGLTSVFIIFQDEETVEATIDYMNHYHSVLAENLPFGRITWGDGFTFGDHPNFDRLTQKNYIIESHALRQEDRYYTMVWASFSRPARGDERGVAFLHLISIDGAILNNMGP